MSNFYDNLSMEQISSVYTLMRLLRRLRVIGNLECKTIQTSPWQMQLHNYSEFEDYTNDYYGIVKVSYDPSKEYQNSEDLLESIFGKRSSTRIFRGSP